MRVRLMKISTFYFENYVIAYNYRILGDTTFIPLLVFISKLYPVSSCVVNSQLNKGIRIKYNPNPDLF